MKKNLKPKAKDKEASDVLDGSYVELQERDFLESQNQLLSHEDENKKS